MTLIVNQLETFDKSNLEMIRIEFAKLQKKLEECQKELEFFKPDIGKTVSQLLLFFFAVAGQQVACVSDSNFFFFSSQATAITQES